MLEQLGNLWVIQKPTSATPRSITVRITSHSVKLYGAYEVEFTCEDECKTSPGQDAPAKKVVSEASCTADVAVCDV